MLQAVALLIAMLIAGPAQAHVFGAGGAGFLQGVTHPLFGGDHLLAMVAVGIWASQLGRPAWWVLPVVFPAAMIGGGLLGWIGAPVPAVEVGIALSVLLLGCLIGFSIEPGLRISFPLVAMFAIFHGYAHGAELPETASPVSYGLGFILATASLHIFGLATGRLGQKIWAPAYRAAGIALSAAGIGFLFA